MKYLVFTLIFYTLSVSSTWGFRQVVIQSVSKSKRSFLTRNSESEKLPIGTKASFIKNNAAYVAIAVDSTRRYVHWFIDNDLAQVSFVPGEIVTMHENPNFIWAVTGEDAVLDQLEENQALKRQWKHYKLGLTRGITETVSEEESRREVDRNGLMGEIGIEQFIAPSVHWKYSGRYEREKIELSSTTLITQRAIFKSELIYYLPASEKFYHSRPYISLGAGIGVSFTDNTDNNLKGYVLVLPSALFGIQLPMEDRKYHLLMEMGVESLGSKETGGGVSQTTDQVNLLANIGITKIF
jgi:hypothetical protein